MLKRQMQGVPACPLASGNYLDGAEIAISRRKAVGPTTPLNIRCPVRVFNPFVRFCEENRLSYWEGVERLMQIAGVDESGRRP